MCQLKTAIVLVNVVSQYNITIPYINASVKQDINLAPRHMKIKDTVLFGAVIKKANFSCNFV